MATYHYVRSTDGCDETFDVYRGDLYLVSFHFWESDADAEEKAQRLVAKLEAANPARR